MAFKAGDSVEVSGEEEGFVGSYYVARILKRVGTDRYLVKYNTLLTEDETELLEEIVPVSALRPSPPSIKVPGFRRDNVVDVYANDGWWVGKITGIGRIKPKEFYVYFDSTGEEIAYPWYSLRVHQEWQHGQWSVTDYGEVQFQLG